MYSSLFASLQLVSDPRMDQKALSPRLFVLNSFSLYPSGCTSWYEIEDYGVEYKDELKHWCPKSFFIILFNTPRIMYL